jgi:hypothetical protein
MFHQRIIGEEISNEMQDDEFEAPHSGEEQQEIATVSEEEETFVSRSLKRKAPPSEAEGESETVEDKSVEEDKAMSRYVVQHGAHREFGVPQKFIIHEAKKPMSVSCGQHINKMLGSKSGKVWEGLRHYHVTIMGGTLKTTGEHQEGPYVCWKPPEGSLESNDADWLRPIPSKVLEYFQPIWIKEIKNKYPHDKERSDRLIASYESVLKWNESKIDGKPKLSVENLGVGNGDLVVLTKKLKSIRSTDQNKGDNTSEASTSVKAKNNDNDANFVTGVVSVEGARTIKLGNVDSVHTFAIEGVLYATYLP